MCGSISAVFAYKSCLRESLSVSLSRFITLCTRRAPPSTGGARRFHARPSSDRPRRHRLGRPAGAALLRDGAVLARRGHDLAVEPRPPALAHGPATPHASWKPGRRASARRPAASAGRQRAARAPHHSTIVVGGHAPPPPPRPRLAPPASPTAAALSRCPLPANCLRPSRRAHCWISSEGA